MESVQRIEMLMRVDDLEGRKECGTEEEKEEAAAQRRRIRFACCCVVVFGGV